MTYDDKFRIVWMPAGNTPTAAAFTADAVQVEDSLFDALSLAQEKASPDGQPYIQFQNLVLNPVNVRTLHRKAIMDKEKVRST